MAPKLVKRQPCEVFSRCCGYMRPLSNWNDAKQAEWEDRKTFQASVEANQN